MAKIQVSDISGMGGREFGGYEWGCQVICARALRFLQTAKAEGQFPEFHTYKNITGILSADNEAAHKLDAFILQHEKLREFGMTGAMHQFAVSHAMKIFEVGRDEYLRLLRDSDRTADDFFEFDDAEAFPEEQLATSDAARG